MTESASPLTRFTAYWRAVYASDNPLATLAHDEQGIPEELARQMDRRLYPEPFYGLWDGDITDDGVLLLINPGQGPASDAEARQWNAEIRTRFATWTKADFFAYDTNPIHRAHSVGLKWRLRRQAQAERATGQRITFLHVIEYFPYHSKQWPALKPALKHHIQQMVATRLAFDAIVDIAKERKVKLILGIGQPWTEVFRSHGHVPEVREIHVPGKRRFSHRFYKYKVASTAMPIIIYVSGAGGMMLPQAPDAVKELRNLLNEP